MGVASVGIAFYSKCTDVYDVLAIVVYECVRDVVTLRARHAALRLVISHATVWVVPPQILRVSNL